MSEVTKYQLFLDTMKLVLKLKSVLEESKYISIIKSDVTKTCADKNISEEDIDFLITFLVNLKEETFYDECMKVYHKFLKYEDSSSPNSLSFLKIELIKKMI